MTHEEIRDDLSLLALGALDAAERRVIEEHLRDGCPDCERELAAWSEVVGLMPLELGEAETPNLKPALLARIRPAAAAAKVIRLPRWVAIPLAAAAALLIAIGVSRDARLRSELDAQRELATQLQAELESAQGDVKRVSQLLADKEQDVTALRAALASTQESLSILQAPGLRLVHLKETPDARPAEGHVLFNPDGGRALFYGFGLPPVAAEKTYELWWITEKEGPVNAGLFHIDERGVGRVDTPVPTTAGAIQAAAVTIEPAGGTAKPTGPMVLLGALKS